jgi:hypothetical protein
MADELNLFKRRIVLVLDYFDDERDLPWNYVMRSGDGRFEAIVTYLLDALSKEEHERSLGVFDDCDAAVKAIYDHLARIDAADRESWRTVDGKLDFNDPTKH